MTSASESYRGDSSGESFQCRLDDLPAHLVPYGGGWRNLPGGSTGPLFVNPNFQITHGSRIPGSPAGGAPSGFALPATIAWVGSAAGGGLRPFWLGPEFENLFSHLQPGEAEPRGLTAYMRQTLARAEVLVPRDYASEQNSHWGKKLSRCAQQFRSEGYAPVAGLIHPFHIAALRRYYRRLIRKGKIQLGDSQNANRYVLHNESVACFFHSQMTSVLTRIAGRPVKPSYVYFASYLPGSELKKHQDREQCEFSVTLCLDYSPEPYLATPWPIHLETGSKRVSVFQAIGDGLVYRGRELFHYRGRLPMNCTSTSIFFHYVTEDFSGALD